MRRNLKWMTFVVLAFAMLACGGGEKKITVNDLKATESSLSDEKGMLNEAAVPAAVEQYCAFVKEKPKDPEAPEWLFKAVQLEVKTGVTDKAIELTNQLVNDYPNDKNAPVALVMLASEVYDARLHDLDKTRATYERVIKDYPDSRWASDAKILVSMLGMTEEEMLRNILVVSDESESDV